MIKYIYIFILIFILFSCTSNTPVSNTPVSNTPVSNTPVSNTPVSNTPISNIDTSNIGKNKKEGKKYSFEDLYNEIIIKNNLQKKWDKFIFKKFVGFFNGNSFNKSKYIFLDGFNNNIQDSGVLLSASKEYLFPKDYNILLDIFKNYEIFNIYKYKLSIDVINDFDNIYKYTKGKDSKERILYYNNNKDYFFSLNTLSDINGACMLISGNIKSFKEASHGHIENDSYINIIDYKDINNKYFMSNEEYNKFINTKVKINDGLFVYKGLLNIVNKYIKSGFNSSYKELFYNKFNQQLSVYYGFSEYTLFFAMKKYENVINKSFCNNFVNEYFIGK